MSALTSDISKLKLIHRNNAPRSLVIAIPGIGLAQPEVWGKKPNLWLKAIPDHSLPAPSIYSFRHGVQPESLKPWDELITQGGILLEAILALRGQYSELTTCPVLFVAHSLGGIVVKEALCAGFEARLQTVLTSVAGVILLGTPHTGFEDEQVWKNVQLLHSPRSKTKKSKSVDATVKRLENLSKQFEQDAADVPILSIYEQQESAVRKRFGNNQMILLIGRDTVEMKAVNEEVLGVAAPHGTLCDLDTGSREFPSIASFVKRSIARAQSNITRSSNLFAAKPTLNELTVTESLSNLTVGIVKSKTEATLVDHDASSGNMATLGTSLAPQKRLSQNVEPGEVIITKRDPALPCWSVPVAKNPEFLSRSDILEELSDQLVPPQPDESTTSIPAMSGASRDLKTFAICGGGGMGKTQIATQFVYEHRDDFDAIFWLHAEERVELESEFAHIAVELDLVPEASQEANNFDIARQLVQGWLTKPVKSYRSHGRAQHEEATWLLIFDNVAEPETLEGFWPEVGSCGSVLLTSRDPLAKTRVYNVDQGLILRELDVPEACELLLKNTWRDSDEHAQLLAPKIVALLGCHPLAIIQMASVIVREHLSFDEFIKRYEEEPEHAELFESTFISKQRQQTSSHTISSVWLLESLKHGSGLLYAMSLFSPDGISEEFMKAAIGLEGTYNYPETSTKYQRARGELLNASLALRDASETKILVHRLTQDAVWARLTDPRNKTDSALSTFSSAVSIVQRSWPKAGYAERHKKDRWTQCESFAPHVLRLKNRFVRASSSLKASLRNNLQFADLLNDFGWYHQERGRNEEAIDCFGLVQTNLKHILDNATVFSGLSLAEQATTKFLLAETHRNMGCSAVEHVNAPEAKFHLTEYNRLMLEEFLPKEHHEDSRLAISYCELATAHIMYQEWNDAISCNLKGLAAAAKVTDRTKGINIDSLMRINIAMVYLLTNRPAEAEPYLVQALKQRVEIYGPNDRVSMITGRAYHGMGLLREAQGKLDESHAFQLRALDHMKDTAGPYHHRTADMYFKVAQHLVRLDEQESAMSHLDLATKTYNNQSCYCAERGRVLFWKAKLIERHDGIEAARADYAAALDLYKARTRDQRPIGELKDEDFDQGVMFWSR